MTPPPGNGGPGWPGGGGLPDGPFGEKSARGGAGSPEGGPGKGHAGENGPGDNGPLESGRREGNALKHLDEKDGYFEGGPPGGEALDGLSLPRDGGDADGYEGGFSGGRGGEARGYEARETSGYDSDGGDSYEGRDARIHEGGDSYEGRDARIHEGGDSYEGRDASGYSYDGGDADADEGGLEGFATLDEAPKGFAGYGAHGDGWESREPSKGPKRARVPEGGSRRGEGQDAAWTEGSDAEVPGSSEGEIDSKGTEGSGSSKEAGNPADPDDPREKHGSLFWHSYPETPPDEFSIKNLRGRAVAGIIPFRRGAVAPGPGELPPRSRAGGPEGTRIPPETPWGRPFGLGGPAPGRKDPSGGGSIGAGTDPEGPPQDAPARSDGEKAAHDPADDWEAFPSDPPPPPLAGWPSVGPGPHIRRSKGRPALMNVLTAALLVPVIAVWVASGALSPWCLAPLVLAPLAAFLLRSANPPALGSFVWLKGTLAGLAVLPAVWHPQPAAFFWHFSPSFLLAGTGAALGGALAAAKPGLLRSPLAPAALLAALLPFAAGWASGLSGPEPEPPPDILLFGGAVGGGPDHSRARGPAGAADWRSGGSSDGSGAFPDGARGADGRSASGYAGAPPAAAWELSGAPAPSGRGNPPAGYPPAAGYASLAGGPAPAGRPPAGRDPGATELAALLALAPLFLFLMARGEAPRLPAMVFLSGLAALAMLKGSVDWGAGVFWSMAAFMVLPELLRGPRRALLGLLLWAPAACEIAASYGWTSRGWDLARAADLGWFVILGMLASLAKFRELRRLQTAAVRAVLLAHPLSLKSVPGGAAKAPPGYGRPGAGPSRPETSPRRPALALTAAVLCRRPQGMPRASSPPGLTCAVLATLSGSPWACRDGCLGAGDCAASCPSAALELLEDGAVPRPLPERCTGCGLCVMACPKGLVKLVPAAWKALVPCRGRLTMKAMDALCESGCLGCGLCRKACPKGALAWAQPAFDPDPPAARAGVAPAHRTRESGVARGPRGGAKPAVNHAVCLDPSPGGCSFECLASCPRDVISVRKA